MHFFNFGVITQLTWFIANLPKSPGVFVCLITGNILEGSHFSDIVFFASVGSKKM